MASAKLSFFSTVVTTATATQLIAAVTGKKIVLMSLHLLPTSATAVTVYLYNGDNNLIGSSDNPYKLDLDGVDGAQKLELDGGRYGLVQTDTAGEAVMIKLGGAQPVIAFGAYVTID